MLIWPQPSLIYLWASTLSCLHTNHRNNSGVTYWTVFSYSSWFTDIAREPSNEDIYCCWIYLIVRNTIINSPPRILSYTDMCFILYCLLCQLLPYSMYTCTLICIPVYPLKQATSLWYRQFQAIYITVTIRIRTTCDNIYDLVDFIASFDEWKG